MRLFPCSQYSYESIERSDDPPENLTKKELSWESEGQMPWTSFADDAFDLAIQLKNQPVQEIKLPGHALLSLFRDNSLFCV